MSSSATYPRLSFFLEEAYREEIARLPWSVPLGEWPHHGVEELPVRRGQGRHPVLFTRAGSLKLVIKELSEEGARREVETYRHLLAHGIRALRPLGWVVREEAPIAVESPVGPLAERQAYGHTITRLARRVLPESRLYALALEPARRRAIADAIADLFVDLHSHGVYWGDGSLDNVLIQFVAVRIPQIGRRTRLRALLADAETAEIHPALSPGLRQADLEVFVEAMRWLSEDLRLQGVVREPLATAADRDYLLAAYERRFAVTVEAASFTAETGLEPAAVLGEVDHPAYLNTLRKHIEEHRWYLGERRGEAVSLSEAAADWLRTVFEPVCKLLREAGVETYFPGKTAAELYVDIMTHKYFLSRQRGEDVGMIVATRDYAERFGEARRAAAFWQRLGQRLREIFGWREEA